MAEPVLQDVPFPVSYTHLGAALSIKYVTGKPIKFISSGEKREAMDVFHPGRVADRILGMGDVVSLVEKAQEQFDEKQAVSNFSAKTVSRLYAQISMERSSSISLKL